MILIDSADRSEILRALSNPAIGGITTNPTLLAKSCQEASLPLNRYLDLVEELCRLPNELKLSNFLHLMVQVGGPAALWESQVARFADATETWQGTLWIKLPPTTDGLATCAKVKARGLHSLVTAVFTLPQALAAIEAGADGVAVYLRRMMESDDGWQQRLASIGRLFKERQRTLLIASISDGALLETALGFSIDITLGPKVIDMLLTSGLSEKALYTFDNCIRTEEAAH
jgi:fructose-6-phosphate aldolase 2